MAPKIQRYTSDTTTHRNGRDYHDPLYLFPFAFVLLALVACNSPSEPDPSDCNGPDILIIPTATRQTDPDLSVPPGPPPDGGNGAVYCPTPIPAATPTADFPTGFVTTDVVNLSLDVTSQDLAAAAIGDDMLAVAWVTDDTIYVALARGGNHFQVRAVDSGTNAALAFSRANRLHLVYEQDGQILYRAADQGTHPADVPPILVASGRTPQVVVDELNWAHVIYEQDGSLFKAKHLSGETWYEQFIAYGTNPTVIPFYNEKELILWGIPTGTYWFGIILAAPYNGAIRIFRYLSWFNVWELMAAFPLPPGEELTGPVGLDFHAVSAAEAWVYASWVTLRPQTDPPLPLYTQPVYEPANPLFPYQIANPQHIYQGLNAVRWRSQDSPFWAGLKQTITVSDPGGAITFDAWGLAEAAAAPDLTLQIGLDPTGGANPDSANVLWSAAANPTTFSQFSLTAPAAGAAATLFLHATLNTPDVPATVVWDAAAATNGTLTNGDFEGPFTSQSTLTIPDGWTPYYQDSGNSPSSGRDVYTVYAAWSANGGSSWNGPEIITANRDASGSTTGAIRPDVFPLITTATEPPAVSFIYLYETGDPPPGTTFLRFGRPTLTRCDLGTTACSPVPGTRLLPDTVVRPSYRLRLAPDPLTPDRAILVWDALQTDATHKDVYATYLVLR